MNFVSLNIWPLTEGETTIYLKILNHKPDPQPVLDHLVPLLCESYENTPIDVWDLTTQQVLPYINGINHVARIATESDVEKALVKACIQNLVYHEVVRLLPLLKYSNVYMCTRNLQNLTKDRALGQSCRWVGVTFFCFHLPTTQCRTGNTGSTFAVSVNVN